MSDLETVLNFGQGWSSVQSVWVCVYYRAKDPFKLADRVPWLLSFLPSSPLYPSIHSPAVVGRVGILPSGLRRGHPTRQLVHAPQLLQKYS